MSITNEAVGQVLRSYLAVHPGDRGRLAPLVRAVEAPAPGSARLTWRRTLPGHVTCSTVAVDNAGRVLQIHHRASGLWLHPGGHVEDRDRSLYGAALRELAEETGIGRRRVQPLVDRPVDVDIHWIPANASKREPEHLHYDFRYLLRVRGRGLSPAATSVDPEDPETTRPLSVPPLATPVNAPAVPGTPGTPGTPGVPAAPVNAPGAPVRIGPATMIVPVEVEGDPGSVPAGIVLQADEVAGARWSEVSALGGRLARRVAAVLGQ